MAELSSWPTQNSGPTGTIDSREAATHIGALVYPHTSALKTKSGFRPGPGTSPGVVTATGTPDGFIHVAPFQLLLQNIRGSGLGCYIACLDAQKDINILSTPADPTNPRDDLIIAQQSDVFDSDANSNFDVKQVVGTPAASPSDPSVTGSTNYVTLARVRVNASATSINSGNITDLRTTGHAKSLTGGLHTVALGGILPVETQAQRDALTGVYSGLAVWRRDLKIVEISDGSAWRPQGMAKIDEKILSGATGTVTFDPIPATYRSLLLEIACRGDTAAQFTSVSMKFNNDGTGLYDYENWQAAGASTTSAETLSGTSMYVGDMPANTTLAGSVSIYAIKIPWYAGTTFWKAVTTAHVANLQTSAGQANALFDKTMAGRWRSTAAINRIDLVAGAGNFVIGSSFALYGLP